MIDVLPEGTCGHVTGLVFRCKQLVRQRLDIRWIYCCYLGPRDRYGHRIGVDPYAAETKLTRSEHRGAAATERVQDPLPTLCAAKQPKRKGEWEHGEVGTYSVETVSEFHPGRVVG